MKKKTLTFILSLVTNISLLAQQENVEFYKDRFKAIDILGVIKTSMSISSLYYFMVKFLQGTNQLIIVEKFLGDIALVNKFKFDLKSLN